MFCATRPLSTHGRSRHAVLTFDVAQIGSPRPRILGVVAMELVLLAVGSHGFTGGSVQAMIVSS